MSTSRNKRTRNPQNHTNKCTRTKRKQQQAVAAQQKATALNTPPQARNDSKLSQVGNSLAMAIEVGSILGLDGFGNSASNTGIDSPLLAGGRFVRSDHSNEELTTTYLENWAARRIIDMPAEDMTRAWYSLATALPENAMDDIYRLEAKHSVKQEITNALRWTRLYGECYALIVLIGEGDILDQPLDKDRLLPGCFQGLLVLDPTSGIEPSMELVTDLDDPDYGMPMYYTVEVNMEDNTRNMEWNGPGASTVKPLEYAQDESAGSIPIHRRIKIHHSRMLVFTGRELPFTEKLKQNHLGISELTHIWDTLMEFTNAITNIGLMLFKTNITTLQSDDLMEKLCLGTIENREQVFAALHGELLFETSFGLRLLGSGDKMENMTYAFPGVPEILDRLMMILAGAAEIPETRLFGRSPQGMNATGEADLQHYYDMINQLQERMLRPALERLLPIMAISCWGFEPEDMRIVFNPIRTMSSEMKMKLAAEHTDLVLKAFEKGVINLEEARAELKVLSEKTEVFSKLDT
jgi:hypothetical protein